MRKNDYLRTAIYYYNIQTEEQNENKKKEYINKIKENVKKYRELNGRYIDFLEIYRPIKEIIES